VNGEPPRLSAAFVAMVMEGPVARPGENPDDDPLRAIASSAVPDGYAHLDQFVKDWKPEPAAENPAWMIPVPAGLWEGSGALLTRLLISCYDKIG
jgi:hypothetical protein